MIQLPSPFLKCVNGFDKIAFKNNSEKLLESFLLKLFIPVFSTAFSLPIELLGADKYNLATCLISSKPPSSTNNSLRMARGNIRFRRMLEQLSTYTNFKILKIQGDSSEDQNTQIASLTFNIEFENDSFIPSSATSIDGSTAVSTREHVIRDLIARALLQTFTEKALVYNNTNTHQEIKDVTCTAVNNDGDTISAITVARVDNFDVAGDSEVPA